MQVVTSCMMLMNNDMCIDITFSDELLSHSLINDVPHFSGSPTRVPLSRPWKKAPTDVRHSSDS
jgi:hypothetical protein